LEATMREEPRQVSSSTWLSFVCTRFDKQPID
jgi:hypothetical protein